MFTRSFDWFVGLFVSFLIGHSEYVGFGWTIERFSIVEFRILGYPGPSKEQGTEVRLMRGKIFRGKIRM